MFKDRQTDGQTTTGDEKPENSYLSRDNEKCVVNKLTLVLFALHLVVIIGIYYIMKYEPSPIYAQNKQRSAQILYLRYGNLSHRNSTLLILYVNLYLIQQK